MKETSNNRFVLKKISDLMPVIKIDDNTSLGPFVRRSESKSETYIYILAFFDRNAIRKAQDLRCDIAEEKDDINIIIEAKNKTDIESKDQSLWSIIYCPGRVFKKKVSVSINFNGQKPEDSSPYNTLGEPTRGTVVIPPNLR